MSTSAWTTRWRSTPRSLASRPSRLRIICAAAKLLRGRSASYAHYEDADLALQAAVIAHGIAETQPFVDGNKREALIAMITFLELNGYALSAAGSELASWIISFSAAAPPEDVAKSLRLWMTLVA